MSGLIIEVIYSSSVLFSFDKALVQIKLNVFFSFLFFCIVLLFSLLFSRFVLVQKNEREKASVTKVFVQLVKGKTNSQTNTCKSINQA